MSDRQSVFHSPRADNAVTTFDDFVDHIDFGKIEKVKSEDALTGHDTAQISITPRAFKDTLTEATSDLATVRSKSTAAKDIESADDFILARETVVRFVQDSIAEAVDQQKRNADKNGVVKVLLFNEGVLVILSTVNLPRHIVTNVGSNKLLPKFIGPFRVLRRLGNVYTTELPCKIRTHRTFCVGRLRSYYQYGKSFGEESPCDKAPPIYTCACAAGSQLASEARISPREAERYPDELPLARREENAVSARSRADQKQNLIDLSSVPRRDVSHCRPDPNVCFSRARNLAQLIRYALELAHSIRLNMQTLLRTCFLLRLIH